ncbi:MAG: hypothetical protein RL577_1054 [Bacteroidota bacterium]
MNLFRIAMLAAFSWVAAVQAQDFSFQSVQYSDSTVWYIHNHSEKWIKPISLTLNWFHQKKSLVIWPYKYEPGYFLQTLEQSNSGRNWSWKFKSSHGLSISDTIYPGDSLPVLISVNYDVNDPDTVMPANITLYFRDSITRGQVEHIVPAGSSCSFQQLFLSSYFDKAGIKYGSHYLPSLHEGGCLDASTWGNAYLMVFNEQTLKPSLAGMMFPRCEAGRLWSTFGYAKDSQLFYSFNFSETSYFDSLVEAISPGDYVALVSYAGATWSTQHASALAKLGFDVNQAGTMQHVLLGRKSLPLGRAIYTGFGAPMASLKWVGMDAVMIPGQSGDSLKPYPDCYETLVRIHEPYIPEVKDTSSSGLFGPVVLEWSISPNPADQTVRLNSPVGISSWNLMDAQGRFIAASNCGEVSCGELPAGVYLIQAKGVQGQWLPVKRLMVVHH